jgi:hypothetical protein
MSSPMNTLQIWAVANHCRPHTLKEYQRASRAVLPALQPLKSDVRNIAVAGCKHLTVLPAQPEKLDELIREQLFDQMRLAEYIHLAPDGTLDPASLCVPGYSLSYYLCDNRAAVLPIDKGGATLRLRGCGASSEASSSISLEMSAATDLCEPAWLRQVLQLFIRGWGCNVGGISTGAYESAIRASHRASYAGQWLFYLPLPNLAKCLPGDIHHEPFANGILIQTTPHIPNPNNSSDIAAGKRVRDVLDEFGLINDATYAIEGWPPDQEESLYEQFISGAPAGRKYTVHCINFDGYDPDRKVLLYAKLFRRLRRHPKEWGLRGWDGPVLNEAKRQVRAAAKAGGVPIEWHIGLEEPAHAVRQLLADYTNITSQQLSVIYTPVEQAHQT